MHGLLQVLGMRIGRRTRLDLRSYEILLAPDEVRVTRRVQTQRHLCLKS